MEHPDRFYTAFPMFNHGFHTDNPPSSSSPLHHQQQRKHYIEQTNVIDTYKRRCNSRSDTSYRRSRSAANQRERRRMQCINEAFEGLRSHIPTLPYEKRLSKVDTLRLSICYINFLTELVNTDADGKDCTEIFSQKYKETKKIVIYNARKEDMDTHDVAPVLGHSLSWSSEKNVQQGNYIKTTKIWRPEDPRKTKQNTIFDIRNDSSVIQNCNQTIQ